MRTAATDRAPNMMDKRPSHPLRGSDGGVFVVAQRNRPWSTAVNEGPWYAFRRIPWNPQQTRPAQPPPEECRRAPRASLTLNAVERN